MSLEATTAPENTREDADCGLFALAHSAELKPVKLTVPLAVE